MMVKQSPVAVLEPETCPCLNRRVRLQIDKVTGKPVLLYPEGVLILNPTGDEILRLCDGNRTVAAIVTELANRHQIVTEDALSSDVYNFLRRLNRRGFVEWS